MPETRRTRRWAQFTLFTVLALVAVVVWAGLKWDGERRGDEITACRGQFNADMLSHAVEVILIQSEGLESIALGDDPGRDDAIDRLRDERDATRTAKDTYNEAADMSVDDPDRFLAICRDQS